MRRIIVVLPHPLGPITETNSPRETSRPSPSTAVTFPNRLVTPTSRTSDSIATIEASIRRSGSRCRVRSPRSAHASGGTCSSKSAAPRSAPASITRSGLSHSPDHPSPPRGQNVGGVLIQISTATSGPGLIQEWNDVLLKYMLSRRARIQRISVTIHHVSPFSELLDPDPIAEHGERTILAGPDHLPAHLIARRGELRDRRSVRPR